MDEKKRLRGWGVAMKTAQRNRGGRTIPGKRSEGGNRKYWWRKGSPPKGIRRKNNKIRERSEKEEEKKVNSLVGNRVLGTG